MRTLATHRGVLRRLQADSTPGAPLKSRRRKTPCVSKESWCLAAIGLADLITTLVWIRGYDAEEANPLFRLFWQQGVPVFVVAKALFLLGPLWVLESARKRHRRFVLLASRTAIVAYLALYGIGVAKLNAPAFPLNLRSEPQRLLRSEPLPYRQHSGIALTQV